MLKLFNCFVILVTEITAAYVPDDSEQSTDIAGECRHTRIPNGCSECDPASYQSLPPHI